LFILANMSDFSLLSGGFFVFGLAYPLLRTKKSSTPPCGWQRWGTNHASCRIFLFNHASRIIFSPITLQVKIVHRRFYFVDPKRVVKKKNFADSTTKMHRQICDLSRENVPYGIRSNGWTQGKWTSLQTGSQRGRKKKIRRGLKEKKKEYGELRSPSSPFRSRLSPFALDHPLLVRSKLTIVNLLVPRNLKTTWFYMSW